MTGPNIPNPYAEAHISPNGPDDARPTARQIVEDNDVVGKLSSKTFLVTGGTAGLGLETVRALVRTGAQVYFTARDEAKAEKVVQDIVQEAENDAALKTVKVSWVKIDNTSLASVKVGAEDFLRRSDGLNVLVCNAGISQTPHALTKDGFEEQFGVNHLAHFYLFMLLKPLLLRSSTPSFNSRVIAVASGAHTFSTVQIGNYNLDSPPKESYDPMTEMEGDHNPMILYGQSKTANIWFANEIDRRYGSQGLHGLSLHPGSIFTAGWAGLDPRISEKFAPFLAMEVFQKSFKSVQQGAATQVLAAIGREYEGKGGVYLEDCGMSKQIPDDGPIGTYGYRSWAYNPDGEKRLWRDSLEMVSVQDDQ